MKKLLIVLIALTVSDQILAQTNDSNQTSQEKVMPKDTIPKPEKAKVVESTGKPKIIYYQSTEPERKKERRQDIKTLSGSMSHSGGFGALSFRSTEFRNESLVMAGFRGGWIINRTLGIGVEGHGIIPTAKFDIEDDLGAMREVNLLGGYGGMFLELIFFSNEVVHVTFPVSAGAGWLGYHEIADDNTMPGPIDPEIDSDVFWYVEPGADLEFNVSRNFRLAFGVSKRFTQDLVLKETDTKAFDELNYFITLKVGGF
jgi:hypothetical protein